jgi:hypothetical protein
MENILNQFKNGFKFKNALSHLYLYLEEIKSSEAQNVYRIGSSLDSKKAIWKLKEEENGYLYISSTTIQGEELFLTVAEDNNIEPKKFTGENNQKFYIQYKEKGLYLIKSRISKNKFGIELKNNKIGINDKLKQAPINGSPEQNWIFEAIEDSNKITKLKATNVNNNMNEKSEKVVKTVIYKDDELVHTVVFVK